MLTKKHEILNLADTMVASAASFSAQGYAELIATREMLKIKLDSLEKDINASVILQNVIKALDLNASTPERRTNK